MVKPEASAGGPAPLEVASALGSNTTESKQGDRETDRPTKHETRNVSTNPSGGVPNVNEIESAYADSNGKML